MRALRRFIREVVYPIWLGLAIFFLLFTLLLGNGVVGRMLGERDVSRTSFWVKHRTYGAALDGETLVVEPAVQGWDLALRIEDERGRSDDTSLWSASMTVLVYWMQYPHAEGYGLF